MTVLRPKTGRLPAYGKALFAARMAGGLANAAAQSVYVHLDCWGVPPLPEAGKWPLAVRSEDEPAAFDWRLVTGLLVVVVHQGACAKRLQALCEAVLAVEPAALHTMNRTTGEYQVVLPFYSATSHD